MPNIEIVGFRSLSGITEIKITKLICSKIPQVMEETVITVHHNSQVLGISEDIQERPYIRVASTSKKDRKAAELINKELGLDVEWLHLDGFYEGKG